MNTVLRRVATPAVVGTALAVVLGAGVALAGYHASVSGSRTGSASAATVGSFTMSVTGAVSTDLYPGGAGADVTMQIANPYGRALTITGVATTGDITVTPLAGSTCATTGLTVSTPSSLPITIPGTTSVTNVTFDNLVTMGASADSGCQGATFTISFVVMGQV